MRKHKSLLNATRSAFAIRFPGAFTWPPEALFYETLSNVENVDA